MSNLIVKNGNGDNVYLSATGVGTDLDPFVTTSSPYYLDAVRGLVPGTLAVHKFGVAEDINTSEGFVDIWDGTADDIGGKITDYNWADSAVIGQISSTVAGDTQTISIQGLDTNWDLVVQEVTLNGQTGVALTTPLRRFFRAYNVGSIEFTGFIYISETGTTLSGGRPTNDTKVFGIVHPENQQTEMALFTVPAGYSLYITQGWCHISKSSTTEAIIKIMRRDFEGVFRSLHTLALQTSGSSGDQRPYPVPLRLNEKTDIIYKAQVFSNSTSVSAGFHGILIEN